MNLEQQIMPTLATIPEDLRLFIVSKVGSTSPIDYFNTIITCKSLSFGPSNNSIARALNLSPFVNNPSLANQYQTLVDRCIEANNPDAHFVKGMIEYFKSKNQILGLHHIRIASKAGHNQGTYVYGILLMALGKTEKGVRIINNFTDDKGISMVETCMASFKRSMDRTFLHVEEIYVSSMKKLWPELNCHLQEGADITLLDFIRYCWLSPVNTLLPGIRGAPLSLFHGKRKMITSELPDAARTVTEPRPWLKWRFRHVADESKYKC